MMGNFLNKYNFSNLNARYLRIMTWYITYFLTGSNYYSARVIQFYQSSRTFLYARYTDLGIFRHNFNRKSRMA